MPVSGFLGEITCRAKVLPAPYVLNVLRQRTRLRMVTDAVIRCSECNRDQHISALRAMSH